jgi:general secretion pathway protein E
VAGYLVTSTVEAVLAQRLVRVLCPVCKVREAAPADLAYETGEALEWIWRAVGCSACRHTGYRGRTGIYELLRMSEALRAAVHHRQGSSDFRQIALAEGMRSLRQDGLRLVSLGVTTIEEVLRVTFA